MKALTNNCTVTSFYRRYIRVKGTLKVITISSAIMDNVPRMVIVFLVNWAEL